VMSRRVVFIVIFCALVFPLLDILPLVPSTTPAALTLLHAMAQAGAGGAVNSSLGEFRRAVEVFALEHGPLVYLDLCDGGSGVACAGTAVPRAVVYSWLRADGAGSDVSQLVDSVSAAYNIYRDREVEYVRVEGCVGGAPNDSCVSVAIVSALASSRAAAGNSALLSLVAVLCIIVGALTLTRDANELISGPIEKLMGTLVGIAEVSSGCCCGSRDAAPGV
jgi:hypothetical protein